MQNSPYLDLKPRSLAEAEHAQESRQLEDDAAKLLRLQLMLSAFVEAAEKIRKELNCDAARGELAGLIDAIHDVDHNHLTGGAIAAVRHAADALLADA